MCDPVTLILGAASLFGSKGSTAAPPPLVPEKETNPDINTEIIGDTGANIAIGGASGGSSAAVQKLKSNLQRKNALIKPDAATKTGAAGKTVSNNKAKVGKARQKELELLEKAGLSVNAEGTGIQIL